MTNRQIILFSIAIIIACFLGVFIFTLPSLVTQLNLTNKSSIGDTIGGITAPIIGIISSILLYLALTKQTESNIEQRIKNESDIVFLLINQLDREIENFYYKYTQGKEQKKFTGLEGLNEFARDYRYENNIEQFRKEKYNHFKDWYEAGQIVMLVDTFNLIEKRIEISNLSNELKDLFKIKLKSFYDCKLRIPLCSLSEAFDIYEFQKDSHTERIQSLVLKYN